MIVPKFAGSNVWFWIGVVEQRDDSKSKDKQKIGRVRVRIIGHHSPLIEEDNAAGEGIPVNKLPWAYPVNPIQSASISGVGWSPTGVVEGTWVVGFAMDGPSMQDLYYIGTLPGVPTEKEKASTKGFHDPNNKYPLNEFLGESDVNRLARADKIRETHVQKRKQAQERMVRSAKGSTWAEPNVPYAAEYPYNHTRTTESGHTEEFDDTPGSERMLWRHKDGTFVEWHPKGDEVHKIYGNQYEITLKDRNMYVKGNINITVNGDANIRSNKNINLESAKNIDMRAMGKISMWSAKGIDMQTTRDFSVSTVRGVSISGGTGSVKITTAGDMKLFAVSKLSIAAIGPATMGSPANQATYAARVVG